jgi:DNA-PKcs, N-terminal/Phosphatidylinositol 3- and 4-kinase/DNA-PKcs, CC5/DNA-dependent protein kinase catalytic subunit, CC1/2/DNA-dependent protein kinase catalytic subunit, CC3/FAT domain/FATC domain
MSEYILGSGALSALRGSIVDLVAAIDDDARSMATVAIKNLDAAVGRAESVEEKGMLFPSEYSQKETHNTQNTFNYVYNPLFSVCCILFLTLQSIFTLHCSVLLCAPFFPPRLGLGLVLVSVLAVPSPFPFPFPCRRLYISFHMLFAELCSELMFSSSSPLSLSSIVFRLIGDVAYKDIRGDIYRIVSKYCQELPEHILRQYAPELMRIAVRGTSAERTNKPRVTLLSIMFVVTSLGLDSDYIRLPTIVSNILNDLKGARSKQSQTVRGMQLQLLGLVSELYPDLLTDIVRQRMAGMYMRGLKEQAESKSPAQRQLIAGSLLGLSHFLVHNSELIPADARQKEMRMSTLFEYVFSGLVITSDMKRYNILRAALEILQRHADLFCEYIIERIDTVFSMLTKACRHPNREFRDGIAPAALESVLAHVSHYLVHHSEQKSSRQVFVVLIKYFNTMMDSPSSSPDDRALCIRAFGSLAKAVVVFMEDGSLPRYLTRLLQDNERLYNGPLYEVTRAVRQFPSFITSYALIIDELDTADASVLRFLSVMIGRLFLVFPNIVGRHRIENYRALTHLFTVLHRKGAIFKQLLEQVVFPALTLTVSELPDSNSSNFASAIGAGVDIQRHGYEEYVQLWDGLLTTTQYNWGRPVDVPIKQVREMQEILFDHLMSGIVRLLETLNLDYQVVEESSISDDRKTSQDDAGHARREDSLPSAPPTFLRSRSDRTDLKEILGDLNVVDDKNDSGQSDTASSSSVTVSAQADLAAHLLPCMPKDYELYLNLVNFARLFLTDDPSASYSAPASSGAPTRISYEFHGRRFLRWVFIFGKTVIALSSQRPLVSGHYKLMSIVFGVCSRFGYFDGVGIDATASEVRNTAESELEELERASRRERHMHRAASVTGVESKSQSSSNMSAIVAPGQFESVYNRRFCWKLFYRFVEQVVTRIQQLRDELLFSATAMVLSIPVEFVDIPLLAPALIKVFEIGLTYEPAAELGISVLERWLDAIPSKVTPHLYLMLPPLQHYIVLPKSSGAVTVELENQYVSDNISANKRQEMNILFGNTKRGSTSRKQAQSAVSSALSASRAVGAAAAGNESTAVTGGGGGGGSAGGGGGGGGATDGAIEVAPEDMGVTARILKFLGRVGGHSSCLVNDDADHLSFAWDPNPQVRISIPYPDRRLDVHLDPMLPRIAYLAENSTDRQIKIAACESLHAIIIYMVAMRATDPGRDTPDAATSPHRIYRQLFPVIIRLATDTEQVTRQLFQPLVFQLIHWLTNNSQREHDETMAMLDAITDAVGNPTSGGLREFAAKCMAEFLSWSLKHVHSQQAAAAVAAAASSSRRRGRRSSRQASTSASSSTSSASVVGKHDPVNVKSLLHRLYSLAHHTNQYQRIGACLTFSRTYAIMRESDMLVSNFLLDIMRNMFSCLQIADRDDPALGTIDQAKNVLARLARTVTDAKHGAYRALNLPSSYGKRSGEAECANLDSFTEWLFASISSPEKEFRRMCMLIFQDFAPLGSHGSTVSEWIDAFMARAGAGRGMPSLVGCFEPPLVHTLASFCAEFLVGSEPSLTYETVSGWFANLGIALDCYIWSMRFHHLRNGPQPMLEHKASGVVDAMKSFFDIVSQESDIIAPPLSPIAVDVYNENRSTACVRIFRFTHLLLSEYQGAGILFKLIRAPFCDLLFHMLLDPLSRGFTVRVEDNQATAAGLCKSLVNLMEQNEKAADIQAVVIQQLDLAVNTPKLCLMDVDLLDLLRDAGYATTLLEGYTRLWQSGMLRFVLSDAEISKLASRLAQDAYALSTLSGHGHINVVSPLHLDIGRKMLQLALDLGLPSSHVLDYLTCSVHTHPGDSTADTADAADTPGLDSSDVLDDEKMPTPSFPDIATSLSQDFTSLEMRLSESVSMSAASLLSGSSQATNVGAAAAADGGNGASATTASADPELKHTDVDMSTDDAVATNRETRGELFHTHYLVVLRRHILSKYADFVEALFSRSFEFPILLLFAVECAQHVLRLRTALRNKRMSPNAETSVSDTVYGYFDATLRHFGAALRTHGPGLDLALDNERMTLTMKLIKVLMSIDTRRMLFSNHAMAIIEPLEELFLRCLSPEASVSIKHLALELVPNFMADERSYPSPPSCDIQHSQSMIQKTSIAIQRLLTQPPFPPKSSMIERNTTAWNQYSSLLMLLLRALSVCQNFDLVRALLATLRERNHKLQRAIDKATRSYVGSIVKPGQSEQTDNALDRAMNTYLDSAIDDDTVDNGRRFMVSHIICPLLRVCALSSVRRFFEKHAAVLMNTIVRMADGPKESDEADVQQLKLMELECCYMMLDIMYRRLDQTARESIALEHQKIIKASYLHAKRTSFAKFPRVPTKLILSVRSAAFECMNSTLRRTQNSMRIFATLCFAENHAKMEFLWENIVDTITPVVLTFETDFIQVDHLLRPLSRDMSALLRGSKRAGIRVMPANIAAGNSSNKYLSSQYLANSSLSQDIMSMDPFYARNEDYLNDSAYRYAASHSDSVSAVSNAVGSGSSSDAASSIDEKKHSTQSEMDAMMAKNGEFDRSLAERTVTFGDLFELDAFNKMPAMKSILETIDFLVRLSNANDSSHLASATGIAIDRPEWMVKISQRIVQENSLMAAADSGSSLGADVDMSMSSSSASVATGKNNIRWFLLKVILNRWRVFGPHADVFFAPIVNLCVAEDPQAPGFHYMLRDICFMFIKWAHFFGFKPSDDYVERSTASAFIAKIMRVAPDWGRRGDVDGKSSSTDVQDGYQRNLRVKSNLEIIRALIEEWRDRVDVDKSIIVDFLSHDVSNRDSRLVVNVGLQLMGILLVNNFPVYDSINDRGIDESQFQRLLLKPILEEKCHKSVYEAASEVQGMILDSFDPDDAVPRMDEDEKVPRGARGRALAGRNRTHASGSRNDGSSSMYESILRDALKSLCRAELSSKSYEKFLQCAVKVGQRHPRFVDSSIMKYIWPDLHRLHGPFLSKALQCVYFYARDEHNIANELKPTIDRAFVEQDWDVEALRVLLLILERIFKTIDIGIIMQWRSKLGELFAHHKDVRCRQLFYRIMIWLVDNLEDDENASLVSSMLLEGLSDDAPEIRTALYAFWDNPARLPRAHLYRLENIFSKLYDPACDKHFVHYSTYLLLNQTRHAADFHRAISDKPLADCKFADISIDASWTTRTAPMNPLFSMSQQLGGKANLDFSMLSQSPAVGTQATDSGGGDAIMSSAITGGAGSTDGISSTPSRKRRRGEANSKADSKLVSTGRSGHRSAPAGAPPGMVLATQAPKFTPTAGSQAFWNESFLTADSDNLFKMNLSQLASQRGQGSLSSVIRPVATRHKTTSEFVQRNRERVRRGEKLNEDVMMGSFSEYARSRDFNTRFSRRRQQFKTGQAIRRQDQYSRYSSQWRKRRAEERSNRVSMYRAYRAGELPDIQIPFRDIILPLQALYHDQIIARQMFMILCKSILSTLPETAEVDPVEAVDIQTGIMAALQRMLTDGSSSEPSFVYVLHMSQREMLTAALSSAHQCDSKSRATKHRKRGAGHTTATLETLPVLEPAKIAASSLASKEYHTGILLLEFMLEHADQLAPRFGIDKDALRRQLQSKLADLYAELGEEDVVRSLNSSFSAHNGTNQVIQSCLTGDYRNALSRIETLLDELDAGTADPAPTVEESRFWEDQRLVCMRQLSMWGDLLENVKVEVDNNRDDLLLDRDLLSFYMTSASKFGAESKEAYNWLCEKLEQDAARRVVEENNIFETVQIMAHEVDVPRTVMCYKRALRKLVSTWTSIPQLAVEPRKKVLRSLQPLVEIEEFVHVYRELSRASDEPQVLEDASKLDTASLAKLIKTWQARFPSKVDPFEAWDDVVMNRKFLVNGLSKLIQSRLPDDCTEVHAIQRSLTKVVVTSLEKAAQIANDGGNSTAANAYLNQVSNISTLSPTETFSVEFSRTKVNMSNLLRNLHDELKSPVGVVRALWLSVSSLRSLEQNFPHVMTDDRRLCYEVNELRGNIHEMIANVLATHAEASGDSISSSYDGTDLIAIAGGNSIQDLMNEADRAFHKSAALFHSHTPAGEAKSDVAKRKEVDQAQSMAIDGAPRSPSIRQKARSRARAHANAHKASNSSAAAAASSSSSSSAAASAHADVKVNNAEVRRILAAEDLLFQRTRRQSDETAAAAFVAVASFCQRRLSNTVNDFIDNGVNDGTDASSMMIDMQLDDSTRTEMRRTFVTNIMHAMRLGSADARSRFPIALEMVQANPESLAEEFNELCDRIPAWMFLNWTAQIVASIPVPHSGVVAFRVLKRVALLYPNAVYFPFNMTLEDNKGRVEAEIEHMLMDLHRILHRPILAEFIDTLDGMTAPIHKISDFMKQYERRMDTKEGRIEAKVAYEQLVLRVLSASETNGKLMIGGGDVRAFARNWKDVMAANFGQNGEKLLKMSRQDFSKKFSSLRKQMSAKPLPMGKQPLIYHSEYLAKFDSTGVRSAADIIELPGQYTGNERPDPERHIRIVSINQTVLVMGSLRRPKRITIHASDERDYHFLVKGGEDLRLDQRIEQLFDAMNAAFDQDAACSRRQMRTRTYQVVPMTHRVGMIEWVPNTAPIKSLIMDGWAALEGNGQSGSDLNQPVIRKYAEHIKKHGKGSRRRCDYLSSIEKANPRVVVPSFQQVEQMVPRNALQHGIFSLCSSPETFITIRNRFARSYAVVSICQYVLGIGDRHLENFLLDQTSGDVIPIDFGMSFGNALQLPVPELMPIRLTRQFRNVLHPLNTLVLLKQDMVTSMAALRKNRSRLLTIMNVFAKEPHLDLVAEADKQSRMTTSISNQSHSYVGDDTDELKSLIGSSMDQQAYAAAASSTTTTTTTAGGGGTSARFSEISKTQWLANHKISFVKRKLLGHVPSNIMIDELNAFSPMNSRADMKPLLKKCLQVVRGLTGNKRSKYARSKPCDTIAEQIDCLIEHASDPNILGRTWIGWMSYM